MFSRALQACTPSRRCNYDGVEGFFEAEDFATGWTSHHAEQVVCVACPEHYLRVGGHAALRCSRSSDFTSWPSARSARRCRFLRGAGWRRCTTTGDSAVSRNHKSDDSDVTICVAGVQEEEALTLHWCSSEAETGRLGAWPWRLLARTLHTRRSHGSTLGARRLLDAGAAARLSAKRVASRRCE